MFLKYSLVAVVVIDTPARPLPSFYPVSLVDVKVVFGATRIPRVTSTLSGRLNRVLPLVRTTHSGYACWRNLELMEEFQGWKFMSV